MELLISIVIGVILGFIIAGVQKSALTSVVKQNAAASYIRQGSFKLNSSNDSFLYKKVDKTEKEKK